MNAILQEKRFILQSAITAGLVDANVGLENVSQSYLRSETDIDNQGTIKHYLTETSKASRNPSEVLLAQNDVFVMTHISMAFTKIATATPTSLQRATAILHSFVNPNVFDATEDASMNAIVNGRFSLSVNQVKILPAVPMRAFERVHTSQQGTTTFDASNIVGRSEHVSGLDGYFPIDHVIVSGKTKIDPEINLGVSTDLTPADETNTVVMLVKGYLISNAKG